MGQVRVTPVVGLTRSIVYLVVYAIIFVSNELRITIPHGISYQDKAKVE